MEFNFIEKEGKLEVEYKDGRYRMTKIKGIGGGKFIGSDEGVAEELNREYREKLAKEDVKGHRARTSGGTYHCRRGDLHVRC